MNRPRSKHESGTRSFCNHGNSLRFSAAFWLAMFAATAILPVVPLRAADDKSVLVLAQANGRQHTIIEIIAGLQSGLTADFQQPVTIYVENLDLQQFDSPAYRLEIGNWLRVKYASRKLDAIVALDEPTADTAFTIRPKFRPQTPMIYLDFERMVFANSNAQTNVTHVLVDSHVENTLAAALRLCPNTRRIAFVSSGGNGYVELYRRDLKRVEAYASSRRLEVVKLIGLTMTETKRRLKALPPDDSIIYYNGIWIDGAGQYFVTRDALKELSAFTSAPIFTFSDTFIGVGMVGGSCHNNTVLGNELAKQVAGVIRTGNANVVPVVKSACDQFIFDWRQLRQHGLNEEDLPSGSDVRNRPPTFWKTYQQTLIWGIVVFLAQSGLIVLLLLHRRRMRRAEDELFQSQQMLRIVMDTIPQRVSWKDCNSVFLGCNQAMARHNGYSDPRDLVGKTDYDLRRRKVMADRYRADDREVMETNRPKLNYEEQQEFQDGSFGWLRSCKVPLHDKDDRVIGVLGTYENITDVKRAQETLHESEQRLRTLADATFEGICIHENGRILDANDQFATMFGYERSELIGCDILSSLIAPEWRPTVAERIWSGQGNALEHQVLHKNGSVFDIEVQSRMMVWKGRTVRVTAVRDITQRKQTLAQLGDSLSLLRATLDSTADGILVVDVNGKISTWSRKFQEMWRLSDSILQSGNDEKLLALVLDQLADPNTFLTRVREIYSQPEIDSYEVVEFKDGRTFERYSHPQRIGDKITGRVWSFRDFTERRQLGEQLRQSQKMEAFGQLAGGVAHDFNNLLTVIQGNVALLQLDEHLCPDEATGLAEIAKAAERAANLTRQLLTFSRRQFFQPKPLDLNEAVASTTKMLQRLIGEHIGLETHFAPGSAPVMADETMMEQMLINLAVNSRDAMPQGGRLVIQTAAITINETDTATNPKARPGAFIRLRVTDTGCGMAPEEMEHIFEPFFTTKEIGKGTGLGLATVFGIVAQHHGWIEVESKLNRGTTFYIHLPRLAESEKVLAAPSPAPAIRGGNETILLVEDEAPVRSLTRTLLERKGYHIIEADSGVSALKVWQQYRDAIDLLLTDMVMPGGVSGRELAVRLLAERSGLKVLYASGYTDDMLGENSPLRNNSNFLEKPFDSHKLLKQVRDCLDGLVRR